MKRFKKLIAIIVRGNRLELIFYVVLVLILLCFFKMSDIIDITTFTSVVIASIISLITSRFGVWLYNRVEDTIKLTDDYKGLVKRYNKENLITHINNNGELVVFPVIKETDLYNKNISIVDDPDRDYELPQIAVRYYSDLIQVHKTSEIYNNTNIRVNNWEVVDDKFIMYTGRTNYYNSLVTNRSMDYSFDNNLSIREVYESGPFMTSLNQSKLSNHLGFNGIIESKDGYVAFVIRGKNVSIGKNTVGSSVGASLKVKYALNSDRVFTYEGLMSSIINEINDELGMDNNCVAEINKDKVVLISAYRDLVEGGKPQLLFYLKVALNKEEIEEMFYQKTLKKISSKKKQSSDYRFKSIQEKKMRYDGNRLLWIKTTDLISNIVSISPDKIIYNKKTYKMVPSTSASVVMFLEWKKRKNEYENNRNVF